MKNVWGGCKEVCMCVGWMQGGVYVCGVNVRRCVCVWCGCEEVCMCVG